MSKFKNWILGVCMIVLAVAGYIAGTLGGGNQPKPTIGETVDQVKQGIEVIKKTEEEKTEAKTPAKTE